MKKLFGILLCLTLLAASLVPAIATAETATDVNTANEVVHFINPTAMTVVGNHLYVADIVEDNKTALLYFYIGDSAPVYKGTVELDGEVTNLSNNGSDRLYAVCDHKVIELKLVAGDKPEFNNRYTFNEEKVISFAYGKLNDGNTEYVLTTDLKRFQDNGWQNLTGSTTSLTATKDCLAIGEYVYYLYGENADTACKGYNGNGYFYQDFNNNFSMNGFGAIRLFLWESNAVAMFSAHSIRYVDIGAQTYTLVPLLDIEAYAIVDVEAYNGKLFVLNDKNKIDVYVKNENKYEVEATIGSDIVGLDVPTVYTSFTLARSKGYPTNIVYKTVDTATSIEEINPETKEYLILGFEGDVDYRYYYVMIGDKFGWVKKSDFANAPDNDSKLEIINTKVDTSGVGYDADVKFNSLNAVYLFKLPHTGSAYETILQSASNMTEVKLLQKFTEKTENGDKIWYYVSFGDGRTGFVENTAVGNFRSVQREPLPNVVGDMKINSTLFEAVKMYLTEDMTEGEFVVDEKKDLIKLYSGERVTVVEQRGDKSYVQVRQTDGTCSFGWVETDRLIGIHAITSNAIVGLSLLGAAIILSTLLLVIFFKRKKRIKANKD